MSFFGLGMSCNGRLTNASMAYLPFWNYTPMGVTNFGGDIQIFPVDTPESSQVGLVFNNMAQQAWGTPGIFGGYPMTPTIDTNSVITQVSQMAAASFNQMGSSEINASMQTISAQKAKLQAQLNDANTKAEDKAKIQEQLDKLEEFEKQIEELKKGDKDPMTAYQEAANINYALNKFLKGETTETPSADDKTKTDKSSENKGTSKADSAADNKGKAPKSNGADSEGDSGYVSYTNLIDDLHDSMFRPGTDNELLESSLKQIDKNNIIDIMLQWNQSYPGESFMEAFMADANRGQKKKYGTYLQRLLRDKATELGIDLSKDEDYKKINKEMNSWFWIDNGVADNYNALIQKIATKMGKTYEYEPYSMSSKK